MILKRLAISVCAVALLASSAQAHVVKLRIEHREAVLGGKAFGRAGAYEKLVGKVDFALDPKLAINKNIVDLSLAPRNAKGEVEFSADFFLLKPVDATRGNGRLFDEVGNRGSKATLQTFQKAKNSKDPTTAEEYGDGALMNQGYTLLWMGWQWDVPNGQMRMEMPIATDHGKKITGLVRGNFMPNDNSADPVSGGPQSSAYAIDDPNSPDNVMTVRDNAADKPHSDPAGEMAFHG